MSVYYVSTNGNDTTGNGSQGLPWLTLTKAENSASDGDTVNVGAGTFQEATYLTAAKQIAWVGAGIGSTILRGNNSSRVIYLNSTKTKSFTGFTISGASSGTQPAYQVEGGTGNMATTFTNCDFIDGKTTTIRMNSGMLGVTLVNCTCTLGTTQAQFLHELGGASGWTLTNCTITAPTGLTMNGLIYGGAVATSGTFSITGCTLIVLSNYAPLRFTNSGFTSAIITDNIITVGSNNTRAVNELINFSGTCEFKRNTITIPSTSTATIPIKFQSTVGTGPNTIWQCENNVVYTYNPDSYGILLGDEGGDVQSKAGAFNGSSIKGNRLYGAPYFGYAIGAMHGIMMGGNINIFYEDNYVYGAAYAAACKGYSEAWTDGYIRNNVFVNCTYPVRMKGQSAIRCVNNVIYNDGSQAGTSLSVTENGAGQDSDNAYLRNNLCIRDADKVYEFIDTSYDTVNADYQGFYLTGTAQMGDKFPTVTYDTLAQWQAGTGQDAHSLSGDPRIKSDYTIGVDSPYFEKGFPVVGVTDVLDVSGAHEITLAGAATFSLDSPYKNRVPIT